VASRSTRERRLLGGGAALAGLVLAMSLVAGVRDDLATLRGRVAAHERDLAEARHAAAILRRAAPSADDVRAGSLLARLAAAADGAVGRERIASMTPATGPVGDGVAEDRVALAVSGTSLADTVRLLHVLETASPPLHVARLELRKHPDDPEHFDAALEVTETRRAP
jgi:hypothetical protein